MAKKMPRRLVALSSSAIATIYFAGFVATRSADAGLASAATPTTTPVTTNATGTSVPTATVGATASATTTAPSTAYKDGTYTGSGTSRRGGVNVSVTVSGGTISNVTITSVSTEYPVSRIASLPAQVVSRQSANVNVISGATYSSQAFQQAVQAALANALG